MTPIWDVLSSWRRDEKAPEPPGLVTCHICPHPFIHMLGAPSQGPETHFIQGACGLEPGVSVPLCKQAKLWGQEQSSHMLFRGLGRRPALSCPPPRGTGKKNQVGLIQLTRCSAFLHGLTRGKPPPPRPPCWASLAGLAFPALTLSPLSPPGATGCPPRPGRQPLCLELLRVTVASRRA